MLVRVTIVSEAGGKRLEESAEAILPDPDAWEAWDQFSPEPLESAEGARVERTAEALARGLRLGRRTGA